MYAPLLAAHRRREIAYFDIDGTGFSLTPIAPASTRDVMLQIKKKVVIDAVGFWPNFFVPDLKSSWAYPISAPCTTINGDGKPRPIKSVRNGKAPMLPVLLSAAFQSLGTCLSEFCEKFLADKNGNAFISVDAAFKRDVSRNAGAVVFRRRKSDF